MRILHTSDWHLGKVLKGQSRMDEQIAVMRELIGITEREAPDLVIVAGDLFETSAPPPRALELLTRTLSRIRQTGATVIAVAGNHDSGASLHALRGWAETAGVVLRGRIGSAAEHLITGTTKNGEAWRCAALPFVSQRYAVRATEMFELTAAEADQSYADHVKRLIARLTEGFDGDAVNLVTAHLTVLGGKFGGSPTMHGVGGSPLSEHGGGGEREAHSVASYVLPPTIFPPTVHYVALGHLHRRQSVPGPCPIHYSGGPIAVDFGEEANQPAVLIVDVTKSTPAKIRSVPLTSAAKLRTIRGDLAGLRTLEPDPDAWLRVYVKEKPRAGLREEVQEMFPRALEVRIDPMMIAKDAGKGPSQHAGRSPRELFGDYLADIGHDDEKVSALFDRLYDEASS